MPRFAALAITLLLVSPLPQAVAGTINPRLAGTLTTLPPDEAVMAWVYFRDKGTHEALSRTVPQTVVSDRSLQRRAKVRPADALVDHTDLPVEQSYVAQVAARVTRVRQQSKWLNGVSVSGTPAQIRSLADLPCVLSIGPLTRARRSPVETELAPDALPPPAPEGTTSFNYGSSFSQVNQINVPAVHDRNNYGQGVVIGVFDNGFRLLNHQVFDTLRPRIIATYDFVDHKTDVAPNNPDAGFGAHGVNTLSTIGGFRSGQLIGPAFGASYILARTENDSSETPFEEDNWVAAIEWADSIGVDVTSTSLGYLDYDAPYTSWTWEDMDGNTTAITRAADMAAGRGILVVNSAGNEGLNVSHNTLGAPADGDSVFTIGAVTSTGTRSSFSSVGPTTSIPPRIKPDVMAQGSTVRVASATNPTAYGTSQGTSFSCPLAAGVAALMVHARPTDPPMEIIGVLRATASRATTPDNQYGWGILNVLAALSPSGVSLVAPADALTELDTTLQLSWTRSRWATSYRLQVASDPLFSAILVDDTTVSDSSRQIAGLLPGTTYYWRVAAKNVYGSSTFTAGWSFSTSALPPAAATLVSPPDSALGVPASPLLAWNPASGAARYTLEVATDPAFSLLVFRDSTLLATTASLTGLAYSTEHFWRVIATNGAGQGPASPVWRFTTAPEPPAPPVLLEPADSAAGVPVSTTLIWNRIESATTYELRLSTNPAFSTTLVHDSTLTDTSLTVGPLQPAVRYFWQVRSRIPSGPGAWPALRQFTTDPGTVQTVVVAAGWNLLALPLQVPDPTTGGVFPTAISPAFGFLGEAGYAAEETLSAGRGYWLKFNAPDSVTLAGQAVVSDSLEVSAGWNLIGGVSAIIDTGAIASLPPAIRVSGFYGFQGGYDTAPLLVPGQGYWVKTNQDGLLLLESAHPAIRREGSPQPPR